MNVMKDVEEFNFIRSQESFIKLQRELLEPKTGGGLPVFEESRSDMGAELCKLFRYILCNIFVAFERGSKYCVSFRFVLTANEKRSFNWNLAFVTHCSG